MIKLEFTCTLVGTEEELALQLEHIVQLIRYGDKSGIDWNTEEINYEE